MPILSFGVIFLLISFCFLPKNYLLSYYKYYKIVCDFYEY
ncbi:hypothetical protein METSMIALI_01420 [Methanobrevibacter smithii DSM 2375]|uniref:Uncharacterized protein n=1 Tax=Methanobrevibacter smithii DSM 2375 TaxID=483214 RepID=B9AGB8_METSM|nr:hypothetical protein METSMIALI_01420 [Methanobrevibacter smithii DSM 2375]